MGMVQLVQSMARRERNIYQTAESKRRWIIQERVQRWDGWRTGRRTGDLKSRSTEPLSMNLEEFIKTRYWLVPS